MRLDLGLRGLLGELGSGRADVVHVLLEHCPDDQGHGGEDQVVEGDVHVVEDGLAGVATVESEDELGDGEEHVLVEEVQDHLGNSQVVPPAVH